MASKKLLKKVIKAMSNDDTRVFDVDNNSVTRTFVDSKKHHNKLSTLEYEDTLYDVDEFINASLNEDGSVCINTVHNKEEVELHIYVVEYKLIKFN